MDQAVQEYRNDQIEVELAKARQRIDTDPLRQA